RAPPQVALLPYTTLFRSRTKAAVKREMGSGELSTISGKRYSPEEVSAFIIKEIKELVDEVVGEGEKEAVITVPAYFTDGQRQAVDRKSTRLNSSHVSISY